MTNRSPWFMVPALLAALFGAVLACAPAHAADETKTAERAAFVADVCTRIEEAAAAHDLPEAYFALLIWTESRFDPNAVSPKGAEGIAQFMPGTARLRGLDDPFDPAAAIPESARYLADLREEFGNLGLAAAAYNAGSERVRTWRAGRSRLPLETQDYVAAITGLAAEDWAADGLEPVTFILDEKSSFQDACRALPARRSPRVAKWQPWGFQVTASFSRAKALANYSRLQREFRDVLGGRLPMVVSQVNYSMGNRARYNVRIGADSRAEAEKLCAKLKDAGGACIVLKN